MRVPRRCWWRRCAALVLCACCLPLALRLLLLGRPPIDNNNNNSPAALAQTTRLQALDGSGVDYAERSSSSSRGGEYAGAYMAERSPGNVSHCRWQYSLPSKLSYLDQQLIGSPESPGAGPHRALPFIVRGASEGLPQVTLCSHASADQVYAVVELARRWEGPLGLAVFAPGRDAGLAVAMIERACRCEPAMAKVSVHLFFPRDLPPILQLPITPWFSQDCSASDLQHLSSGPNGTERRRSGLTYPINVARNLARSLAPTQRVLVSDVELLPSEKLASRFMAMLKGRAPKRAVAFVLPVFEIEASERPPSNKRQLLAALRAGAAVYFHRFSCPHCQRFPGLTRWILRPDPGRVRPLIITRREYPHHRWEPIFIGTKHDPLYTEEMSWEGRQDKMTQMFEMCLMNYRLIILDGAFLVHRPGIKRKPLFLPTSGRSTPDQQSTTSQDERQRSHERRNARVYQQVTRRLLKRYPANRRCRP